MAGTNMKRLTSFIFLFAWVAEIKSIPLVGDGAIVQTTLGPVQGIIETTPQGREYNSFISIPYGKAPIDELRYKPPVPADPWVEVYQANLARPCLQPVPFVAIGVEDCLAVTVYTPALPSGDVNPSLPVQVFIHGGAYFLGDIDKIEYGPNRYMNTDMVLVLVNYRLSALGYLSTGDDAALGNYGMLDQTLALQWVRDNVAAFGGNPNDVTLSGESAGSASVLSHILSPLSAGLFNRAIAESGSALCPWAFEENPLPFAQLLAEQFQCPTDDTYALVACLNQQDPAEVQVKSAEVMIANLTLAFVPVIENPVTGLFITEDPTTLLEEGRFNQVPLLMGFNRDEGVLIYEFIHSIMQDIDDHFFDVILPDILRVLTDYRQNLVNVSYAIKDEYYTNVDLTNQTTLDTTNVNLLSDMFMKSWVVQTIELISSHGVPVHMYAFNYVSTNAVSNFTGEPDIVHGEELKYLFDAPLSEKDAAWQPNFFNKWVNFITRGDPNDEGSNLWPTTPPGQSTYMDINEVFTMVDEYDPEKINFWFNVVPAIVYG